jgi:hypothetical protein
LEALHDVNARLGCITGQIDTEEIVVIVLGKREIRHCVLVYRMRNW